MLGLRNVRIVRRSIPLSHGFRYQLDRDSSRTKYAALGPYCRRLDLAVLGEHALSRRAVLKRIQAGPGQESVWDYPRPPVVKAAKREIRVAYGELEIARSVRAVRVLETYGAPVYYVPPADVATSALRPSRRTSACEWKGTATYFDLICGGAAISEVIKRAAWSYPEPEAEYDEIAGYYGFSPGLVDCYVDGERASAQPGGNRYNYGGWVTHEIVGPMKGEPGTEYW